MTKKCGLHISLHFYILHFSAPVLFFILEITRILNVLDQILLTVISYFNFTYRFLSYGTIIRIGLYWTGVLLDLWGWGSVLLFFSQLAVWYYVLLLHDFLLPLQGITLVVLIIHTFFPISYEGSRIYWKNTVNKLKVCCSKILLMNIFYDFIYFWRNCYIYLNPSLLWRKGNFIVSGINLMSCC